MNVPDALEMMDMILAQAKVHETNPGPCVGLPYCVSCRSVVLINNNYEITEAETEIANTPAGTIVKLS